MRVKFAMNKRYFVKRGKRVDLRSLVRNIPSSVTLMDDPEKDVQVQEAQDVTSSAYAEQDRLNLDFDDVAGAFSGSSVQSSRNLNETVGGMNILTASANKVENYQLYIWIEALTRAGAAAGDPAGAGIRDRRHHPVAGRAQGRTAAEVRHRRRHRRPVAAGTHPRHQRRLRASPARRSRSTASCSASRRCATSWPTACSNATAKKISEVIKEIFGKLGYKSGGRFFDENQDPAVTGLKAMVQQLEQRLAMKQDPELTKAQIRKVMAEIDNIQAERVKKGVESAYSAMQAAGVIAATPQTAPIADTVMAAAGYRVPVPPGVDPNFGAGAGAPLTEAAPEVSANPHTHPNLPQPPESAGDGAERGIETPAVDAVPA